MNHSRSKKIFSTLSEEIDRKIVMPKGKRGLFRSCAWASFIKLIELNHFINKSRSHEGYFFYMSCLRGVCEDYIFLNYLLLYPPNDRDSLILLLLLKQSEEAIRAQTAYFGHNREKQWILVNSPQASARRLSKIRDEIQEINKRGGPKTGRQLPTIQKMASESEISDLYDFLYRGTSKVVHFNPHHLLRLGWGPDNEKREFFASTRNFSGYYRDFTRFYAALVFVKFVFSLGKFLRIDRDTKRYAKEIEKMIDDTKRWPELITFEEMNIDPRKFPNFLNITLGMVMAYDELRNSDP